MVLLPGALGTNCGAFLARASAACSALTVPLARQKTQNPHQDGGQISPIVTGAQVLCIDKRANILTGIARACSAACAVQRRVARDREEYKQVIGPGFCCRSGVVGLSPGCGGYRVELDALAGEGSQGRSWALA